jgi:hypothetical protein
VAVVATGKTTQALAEVLAAQAAVVLALPMVPPLEVLGLQTLAVVAALVGLISTSQQVAQVVQA